MVPDHVWAPEFFGPQEIWSPRNLCHEKFGPSEVWSLHENHYMAFYAGTKLLGAQIYRGPKKSRAQMRSGTISVRTAKNFLF